MAKVFWTAAERDKVYREYLRMQDCGALEVKGEESWRNAQSVLPAHRRRVFSFSSSAAKELAKYRGWLYALKNADLVAPTNAGHDASAEDRREVNVKPVEEAAPHRKLMFIEGAGAMKPETYDAVVRYYKKDAKENPPTIDSIIAGMLDIRFEVVTDMLVRRMAESDVVHALAVDALYNRILSYFEPAKPEGSKDVSEKTNKSAAVNKPVVVILNAKESQRQEVADAFPNLEVRKSVDGRIPRMQNVKMIIGMTKFMSHSTDHSALADYKKEIYHRVHGSSSAIIRKIKEELARAPVQH